MQVKFVYGWKKYVTEAYKSITASRCALCKEKIDQDEYYTRKGTLKYCFACRPFIRVQGGVGVDKLDSRGLPPLSFKQQQCIQDMPTYRHMPANYEQEFQRNLELERLLNQQMPRQQMHIDPTPTRRLDANRSISQQIDDALDRRTRHLF